MRFSQNVAQKKEKLKLKLLHFLIMYGKAAVRLLVVEAKAKSN